MVVPLLLKLLLVGVIAVVGYFGAQTAFHFTGSAPVQQPGSFTIPGTNETIQTPNATNTSTFHVVDWLYTFPTQSIIDVFVGGIGGFVSWLSHGVYALMSWIVNLIFPRIVLPEWMGTLVIVLILIIIMYASWNNVWTYGHGIGMWMVIIFSAIIVIAAILSILGLIPK